MTMATITDTITERFARIAVWRPGGATDVAPEDRIPVILLVVGSVLMPLGVVVILLGWYGAAKTPYGFEQVPYLISGGLLGLGLLFAGGFLFFGSWVARVAITSQRTAEQLAALTAQLQSGALNGDGSAPTAPANASASTARTATSGKLVATATGTMLHRSDCPIVASRDNIRTVSAKEQGSLQPCQICNPLD
jgi:hypothetical protein